MHFSVYIADLRHNYSGVLANDCMPLGAGYIKAVMDQRLPEVSSRIFAYPDRLIQALRSQPPNVLMLSNYVWNERLSLHAARLAKRINPRTLVVMGGPNIHLEPERRTEYLARHDEIDLYVLGEADFAATDIARRFIEAGLDHARLGLQDIPSAIYRRDGQIVMTAQQPRHYNLDEIPSPWLAGILDEFFDGRLAPMIETNRGCPRSCAFCVQGSGVRSKVGSFSTARLREEIAYIARTARERAPQMGVLRIADSNFGMFPRDEEIAALIGETRNRSGWPAFIDATTGGTRPDRAIEALAKMGGALTLCQAVQSLEESVLKEVRRARIDWDTLVRATTEARERGLHPYSDLILGLPRETAATHLRALRALLDAGIRELHNFQSMLLKGSELETVRSREKHRFESRFRVLPKNFGEYDGDRIFDMDEIVVATNTLSMTDYVECRQYHWCCSVFAVSSWFDDFVQFARQFGITPSRWLDAIVDAVRNDPGEVGALLRDFTRETEGELFESEAACREFYSRDENFARLLNGEVGDNLMYRYRAIASFFAWDAVVDTAAGVTRQLIRQSSAPTSLADSAELWRDLTEYTRLRHAHGRSADEILQEVRGEFHYDVKRWVDEGMPRDLGSFRFEPSRTVRFRLEDKSADELRGALRVWSTDLRGLTKAVTRIRGEAQRRLAEAIPADS